MPFFQYWHIYYDSTFVKTPFKLPFTLLQQLQIEIETLPWPSLPELPQLPHCLLLLESFLLDQSNWRSCESNYLDLEKAQMQLNTVLLGLQCEKCYGTELWKKSKRRVEASIIHFFFFLKRIIAALIPSNCLNIQDAFNKKKLFTTLSRLESLINRIISYIPSIYSYMIIQFKEEEKIILQFFEEVNNFVMNLPTVSMKKLHSIPKIMEHIFVINPLEENKKGQGNNFYIRKKNATLFETTQQITDYNAERQRKKHSMNNFKVVNNSIVKSKKSSDNNSNNIPVKEAMNLFKFSDKIRNYSIKQGLTKKISVGSVEGQKPSNNKKQLVRSRQHLLSVSNYSMSSQTLILPSEIKPKKQVIAQKRQRQQTMNTVDSNNNQLFNKLSRFIEVEEIEIQREQKLKKKKIGKILPKTCCYSQQQSLMTGARKGWGIIRQYINQKIARKKLKKLLFI